MNMSEVNNGFYLDNERQKEVAVLSSLLDKNGSCSMNGYLGSSNVKLSFDDAGILEFETRNEADDFVTESWGAVLSDGVVIKQVQKNSQVSYNQLFSWDVDSNSYTYLVFDNMQSMNDCYDKIKAFDVNLNKVDISSTFAELGISFDDVAQVLLNQKVDSVASLVDEAVSEATDDTSFVL